MLTIGFKAGSEVVISGESFKIGIAERFAITTSNHELDRG